MRTVVLLGASGSIGRQALEVVERSSEIRLVGLSAHTDWETVVRAARDHGVDTIALADEDAGARAAAEFDGRVLTGRNAPTQLVEAVESDVVANAMVGAAGLRPTVRALELHRMLALANKESLVVGGELVMRLVDHERAPLVPIDSEHSALHQLLEDVPRDDLRRIVITASGGPFRGRPKHEVASAKVDEALAHPTWAMGPKNTIDSATLANKGLEVIEAHHLLGLPYDDIDVLVHPKSIVHALVELVDATVLAHLSVTDMRMAISYALHHPRRADVGVSALDLVTAAPFEFEHVDHDAFPSLGLAIAAGRTGGTAPCVLNAANEVAVTAFVEGRLVLGDIPAIVEATLEQMPHGPADSIDHLLEVDARARETAAAATGLRER